MIRQLFSLPVFPDEEQTQRARSLHFIIWSFLLILDTQFFVFFFLLPQNWPRWLAIILTFNFTLPLLLVLNYRGHIRLAGLLLMTMMWLLGIGLALTAGGIRALVIFMFAVDVIIAARLFGGRGGVIAGIVFSLTGLGLVLVEWAGLLPASSVVYTTLSIWVLVAMSLEFVAIFQFLASRSIKAALTRAQRELHKRRQTEIALAETEQRYREVFETTSDCVFLLDVTADGQFLIYRFNPAEEEAFGFKSAEVVGKTPEHVLPPDEARAVTANYQRCVAQGSPIDYEETLTSVHGKSYYFHTTLIPVKNTEGRISRIVGVAHNITERKAAETALRRSHDELETRVQERTAELQQVNQELEAFSYSVSHDLRSPLRTVTGFADILMSEHARDLPSDAQNLLAMISDSALRMNQLIEALLDLSHIDRQPLVPRPVDLTALARQTIKELQAEQADRKMDIRVADLPECMGDPALLRQVLINLLSNAMKFTRNRPVAVIEVGFKTENAKTVYFVRDNGIGFDMQHARRLFGVFQRLHSREEFAGTGVGLSIVRRIIHRHGGTIWAEAAVDQGATFYFTLPRREEADRQ